jgi:CelD/BcsL family acetyltransferase involved in cellulose biosynthesis
LLLLLGEREERPTVIAPLFADSGMVFFVGSGGSDYLDFIGDLGDGAALARILAMARERVEGFLGFRFCHVPDHSRTGELLRCAAKQLGMFCFDEGEMTAPVLDLHGDPEHAAAVARKKSLLRHERYFVRNGDLDVVHFSDRQAILPQLRDFFAQHVARWSRTPYPSLFEDGLQRQFYEHLVRLAGAAGWLRFTTVRWNERPIAYHFGFSYGGTYLWYKPSFDVELAKRSPGEVLLRHLLLAAMKEGASLFDFGLGDELFKRRFATRAERVRTWGMYPQEILSARPERCDQ